MYIGLWIVFGITVGLWASTDAESRNKSGFLAFFLILISGPFGLVAWLLLRPEKNPGGTEIVKKSHKISIVQLKKKVWLLVLLLLAIGIFTNLIQFKNVLRYKTAADYTTSYLLQDVVSEARRLSYEIHEMKKTKKVDVIKLCRIQMLYAQLDSSLFHLRDIPTREQDKNRGLKNHFFEYIQLESEISDFMLRLEQMNELERQSALKDIDRIGFIHRIQQLTTDIRMIVEKHTSSLPDGGEEIKISELEDILKELGQVDL